MIVVCGIVSPKTALFGWTHHSANIFLVITSILAGYHGETNSPTCNVEEVLPVVVARCVQHLFDGGLKSFKFCLNSVVTYCRTRGWVIIKSGLCFGSPSFTSLHSYNHPHHSQCAGWA